MSRLEAHELMTDAQDLSDDSPLTSLLPPSGRQSAIRGAQRAYEFRSNLLCIFHASASSSSGSVHVDQVARQLIEPCGELNEAGDSPMETIQARFERCYCSAVERVSDPEYWMEANHGSDEVVDEECCHEVRAQSLKEHWKNVSSQFLQLRSKRYLLCLGSLMFDLFSEVFPQLQTNKPNLKHLSPLVSHQNFYSCGIIHIKGEVGKG